MRKLAILLAACALAAPAGGSASIEVARNAQRPTLKVDARGWAEVAWTSNGTRRTLLVPPKGRLIPGGRLTRPDVSRPTRAVSIPFSRALRRTPDGRLWALQVWSTDDGPPQLRFSRWRGRPTQVEATVSGDDPTRERLSGSAVFAGVPVTGTSPSPQGTLIRHYAWIDCFACAGATGWHRIAGVRPNEPDGRFTLLLRPTWLAAAYRVTVNGPNRGATLAPDASVVVERTRPGSG